VNRGAPIVAVLILVAIGAIEGAVSADQLARVAGRPQLGGAGVLLTALGLLASVAVYVVLGRLAADERGAIRTGAIVGAVAGVFGGAIRALLLRDAVVAVVERSAVVPDWFVTAVLAVFVVASVIASAVGGGTFAWVGHRSTRAARPRPPA
jgi:hypothetical protein